MFTINPIGHVRSDLQNLEDCPKQGRLDGPAARVIIQKEYRAALQGLRVGGEILLLTWLHQASRDRLTGRAQGNPDNPEQGIFALRSPHRPNPVGLHQARIVGLDIQSGTVDVFPLEALDGTPVVDIKPVLGKDGLGSAPWGPGISAQDGKLMTEIGRQAGQSGLVSGVNGNISLRRENTMIITASGSAKARLQPGDLVAVGLDDARIHGPGKPSTEAALHRAVYAAQPEARAIVHLHPPHLLALSLVRTNQDLLDLPLFEAREWAGRMIRLERRDPGSQELATQVGQAATSYPALFLDNHGLVCWGPDLHSALNLSEELEGLARIEVLRRKMGASEVSA